MRAFNAVLMAVGFEVAASSEWIAHFRRGVDVDGVPPLLHFLV